MTKKILVVDDEPDVAASIKYRLNEAGYTVLSSDNGVGALETLRREKVDLILADFMMPEVNGIELTRLVKSHPTWFDTKVVLFSCNTAPEFRQRAIEMGAADYIPKSVGAQSIIERVTELIGPALTTDLAPVKPEQPSASDNGLVDGEDNFRLQVESLARSLVDVLHLARASGDLQEPTEYAIDSARRIADDIQRLSSTRNHEVST